MLINSVQQKQLSEQIAHWEIKTDAEIIAVIARKSDHYRHVPVLWAALVALLIPFALSYTHFWLSSGDILIAQWLTFLVCTLLGFLPPLHRLLTPKSLKKLRATRMAKVQFIENNLHHTRGATGVLIFISEFEHSVEILVDQGISQQVDADIWKTIVEQLAADIRRNETTAGLSKAIDSLGVLLSEKVPATHKNNELPNHIILL